MTDPRLRNPPLAETAAQLHLVRCFADEINERNFADKRLYLLQAIDRLSSALSALPLPPEEQPGWKAEADRLRRNLEKRDEYIVGQGLWDDFVSKLGVSNAKA